MADLRSFGKKMNAHGARVAYNADQLVRRVALAVDATVVIATPVDTGRARSNWQAAIGGPVSGFMPEAYVPGKEGSTGAANVQAATDQARGVIAGYKAGQTIHITNNLDYIGALNRGTSAQAARGFVQTAILTGIAAVRAAPGIVSATFKAGD